MNHQEINAAGYKISTDEKLLNIDLIHQFLNEESYWAKGIPFERLERALQNSLCFGVYQAGVQVGFARVVTDKATFAYLCDVFILQEHRGKGLSKWLLQTILSHPELQGLRRWNLATADAHELYAQFNFKALSKPTNWLEIFTPYTTISTS